MQTVRNARRHALAFAASVLLHVVLALSVIQPPSALRGVDANASVTAFVVPAENPDFPGLQPFDRVDQHVTRSARKWKSLVVPSLRIDLATIAARRHVLFPILDPGLAIERFFLKPDLMFAGRAAPPSRDAATGNRPALVLDDRGVQSVVDRSWARRGRWQAFQVIAGLINTHAAGGSLPRVLRCYREQNALQPYADRDARDPRLWTQLSLAADHVSFIGFIRTYAASHPGADETSELLLLLDSVVQAEQDALHVLLDSDPATELSLTRTYNPDAYALLVQIRQEYRDEATRRGLISPRQIDSFYEDARLAILRRVIDTASSVDAADDARFLRGAILWRAGRQPEALTDWRGLTARSQGTYRTSSAAVRAALAAPQIHQLEIDRILKFEDGRWMSMSYDRLRHFGYRLDTY